MPLPDADQSRKSVLDINAYPSGADGMAALCRDRIAELEALKAKAAKPERAAPLQAGDPSYSPRLDRDGDGCE